MNDQTTFARITAISAILSAPLQIAGLVYTSLAVDFNFEVMSNQGALIGLGESAAQFMSQGEYLAMFGYYLLLIPVALYLWRWLRPLAPNLVTLYTLFGLGFIFIGISGAMMRATVLPEIMRTYAYAASAEREMLGVVFKVLIDVVFSGLGALEAIFIGVWWLGIGWVMRTKRRFLGIFTTVLGVSAISGSAGAIFHTEALVMLEGFSYFLWPIWVLWLGIVIWRHGKKSEQMVTAAATA